MAFQKKIDCRVGDFSFIFIVLIITILVIGEGALYFKNGVPPLELNPPDFDYNYVEIYKRFFKEAKSDEGKLVYQARRSRSNAKPFLIHKIQSTKRIFVIGGSVATMIFDQVAQLQDLLEKLFPDLRFEIINCGMGGYDSYRDLLVLNEIVNYHPDLIIVMSGNNEFYYPVKVNLFAYRCNRFLRRSWIYRILQHKFVKQNNFPLITPENRSVSFEKNLKTMINKAKKRGIPIALCTLPSNFRDCPPQIGVKELLEKRIYFRAWYCFNEGKLEEAQKEFKQFIEYYPENPFGYFFLAQCYDKLGDYYMAKAYYLKALDLDVIPGDRCSPKRNLIIRNICATENVNSIDLEKIFIDHSQNGLLGGDFFIDNCHWLRKYDFLVYREFLKLIIKYNSDVSQKPSHIFSSISFAEGFNEEDSVSKNFINDNTSENKYLVARIMYAFIRLTNANFALDERAIAFLKMEYQLNPIYFENRLSLREKITQESSSNLWSKRYLTDFNKIWPVFLYHLGEVFRRLGLYEKAIEYFNEAIKISGSDFWFPFFGRGLAEYKIGDIEKAKIDFDLAEMKNYNIKGYYKELLDI